MPWCDGVAQFGKVSRVVEERFKRFALRFDGDDRHPESMVVTVLIDGKDRLRGRFLTRDFIGFHPSEILGLQSPLLPRRSPRRVAVYRCNCGEPGCGVVAPMIAEQDGVVSWYDFRNFTALFTSPVLDDPVGAEDEEAGVELRFGDINFDSAQYRNEIGRAVTEWRQRQPGR